MTANVTVAQILPLDPLCAKQWFGAGTRESSIREGRQGNSECHLLDHKTVFFREFEACALPESSSHFTIACSSVARASRIANVPPVRDDNLPRRLRVFGCFAQQCWRAGYQGCCYVAFPRNGFFRESMARKARGGGSIPPAIPMRRVHGSFCFILLYRPDFEGRQPK